MFLFFWANGKVAAQHSTPNPTKPAVVSETAKKRKRREVLDVLPSALSFSYTTKLGGKPKASSSASTKPFVAQKPSKETASPSAAKRRKTSEVDEISLPTKSGTSKGASRSQPKPIDTSDESGVEDIDDNARVRSPKIPKKRKKASVKNNDDSEGDDEDVEDDGSVGVLRRSKAKLAAKKNGSKPASSKKNTANGNDAPPSQSQSPQGPKKLYRPGRSSGLADNEEDQDAERENPTRDSSKSKKTAGAEPVGLPRTASEKARGKPASKPAPKSEPEQESDAEESMPSSPPKKKSKKQEPKEKPKAPTSSKELTVIETESNIGPTTKGKQGKKAGQIERAESPAKVQPKRKPAPTRQPEPESEPEPEPESESEPMEVLDAVIQVTPAPTPQPRRKQDSAKKTPRAKKASGAAPKTVPSEEEDAAEEDHQPPSRRTRSDSTPEKLTPKPSRSAKKTTASQSASEADVEKSVEEEVPLMRNRRVKSASAAEKPSRTPSKTNVPKPTVTEVPEAPPKSPAKKAQTPKKPRKPPVTTNDPGVVAVEVVAERPGADPKTKIIQKKVIKRFEREPIPFDTMTWTEFLLHLRRQVTRLRDNDPSPVTQTTMENIVDYYTNVLPLAPKPSPNPENKKLADTLARYEELIEALQSEVDMWEKLKAEVDEGIPLPGAATLSEPSPGRRSSRGGKKEEALSAAGAQFAADGKNALELYPEPPKNPDSVEELLQETDGLEEMAKHIDTVTEMLEQDAEEVPTILQQKFMNLTSDPKKLLRARIE